MAKHKPAIDKRTGKPFPKGRWGKQPRDLMRVPHPPEATRFFARVRQAILECPRCGTVIRIQPKRYAQRRAVMWDASSSRLTCHHCGKTYVVGLIAWPVQQGGGAVGNPEGASRPRDQVPNERQLSEMRAEGAGWWMPDTEKKRRVRPDDTNVTASCTCGAVADPHCPIHREG